MIPEKVRQVLDRHGLTPLEFEAGSTPTSEAAAARIGVRVGQIAKSILLCGKDKRFRLAVMPGDRKISSARFKRITGVKHRMAGGEETLEQTGFRVGGVCPFALEGIEIYIDRGLQKYDLIYPAAGNDASGVPIRFDQLVEITRGRVCDMGQDTLES
ncbi:MAG: YbaK/EbsC family protein [Desulfohalobiaceae bacterium]|nr:YbaK/EbsC family protein [Desulfohalobiaceae bacterium]